MGNGDSSVVLMEVTWAGGRAGVRFESGRLALACVSGERSFDFASMCLPSDRLTRSGCSVPSLNYKCKLIFNTTRTLEEYKYRKCVVTRITVE